MKNTLLFPPILLMLILGLNPLIAQEDTLSRASQRGTFGDPTSSLNLSAVWAFGQYIDISKDYNVISDRSIGNRQSVVFEFEVVPASFDDQVWLDLGEEEYGIALGVFNQHLVFVGEKDGTRGYVRVPVSSILSVGRSSRIVASMKKVNKGEPITLTLFVDNIQVGSNSEFQPAQDYILPIGFHGGFMVNDGNVTGGLKGVPSLNNISECKVYHDQVAEAVAARPFANFRASQIIASPNEEIQFTDQSTNTPTTWNWTFSEGSQVALTSTLQSPKLSLPFEGVFDVKLQASNAVGTGAITRNAFITVRKSITDSLEKDADWGYGQEIEVKKDYDVISSTTIGNRQSAVWEFNVELSDLSDQVWLDLGERGYGVAIGLDAGNLVFTGEKDGTIGRVSVPATEFLEIGKVANIVASMHKVDKGEPITLTLWVDNRQVGTDDRFQPSQDYIIKGGKNGGFMTSDGDAAGGLRGSPKLKNWPSCKVFFNKYINNTPPAPVAAFTVNENLISPGGTVIFIDQSLQDPTAWEWTFSGLPDSISTSRNPVVRFMNEGDYDVKLKVSNAGGSDSLTKQQFIKVRRSVTEDLTQDASWANGRTIEISPDYDIISDSTLGNRQSCVWEFSVNPTDLFDQVWLDLGGNGYGVALGIKDGQIVYIGEKDGTIGQVRIPADSYLNVGEPSTIVASMKKTTAGEPITLALWINNIEVGSDNGFRPAQDYILPPGQNSGFMTNDGDVAGGLSGNPSFNNSPICKVYHNAHLESSGTPPPDGPPVPAFSASATNVKPGESITFTDESTNNPDSWLWVFRGDGEVGFVSTVQNPTLIMPYEDTYDVRLQVSNESGSNSLTKEAYISTMPRVTEDLRKDADWTFGRQIEIVTDYGAITDQSIGNRQSAVWEFTVNIAEMDDQVWLDLGEQGYGIAVGIMSGNLVLVGEKDGTTGKVSVPASEYLTENRNYTIVASMKKTEKGAPIALTLWVNNREVGTSNEFRPEQDYILPPGNHGGFMFTDGNAAGGLSGNPKLNNNATGLVYFDQFIESGFAPPVANFTSDRTTAKPGDIINFTDRSSNNPTSWNWAFLDNGEEILSSTQENPAVAFPYEGSFDVSLRVSNEDGSDFLTRSRYITITDGGDIPIPPEPCGPDRPGGNGEMVFKSGFEDGVYIDKSGRATIKGQDGFGGDWSNNLNNFCSSVFYLDYQGATDPDHVESNIIQDPDYPTNRVLQGINKMDAPGGITSRWQAQCIYNQNASPTESYMRVRMRFADGVMENYQQYPNTNTWFIIGESWENRDDNLSGNVAGKSRIDFKINKMDASAGSPLSWSLHCEKMQPANEEFEKLWYYENKSVPIPTGWFTLEIYLKWGDRNNGRMWVAITPDGDCRTILFDVNDYTHHPSNPRHLHNWQFLKLYIDKRVLDHLRNRGTPASVYYDDLEFWSSFPPISNR